MLKMELLHSHIIVAIFCGWEPRKPTKEFPNGYLELTESITDTDVDTVEINRVSNDNVLEELPYSTDWNYLMAAYNEFRDKAEDLLDIDGNEAMKIRDTLIDAILDYNLDLAFKELLRGINQINELKLNQDEN